MILLDFIATLIEDFILCFVPFSSNKVKDTKVFLITMFLCLIETFFFNYIIINNNFLILIMPVTIAISLYLKTKKMRLSYFILPIIIETIIISSTTIAMCLVSAILNIPIVEITKDNQSIFILIIILSRVFLIVFSLIIIKLQEFNTDKLPRESLLSVNIFLLSAVLMFSSLMSSVVYESFSISILYQMISFLFVLCASSIYIFYIIVRQNEENMRMSQKLMSDRYQKDLYALTQRTQSTISKDIHMMKYSLLKIINYLQAKDHEEVLNFARNELDKYMDYDMVQMSNNPIFDFELTTLINELKQHHIDLKTVISIQENSVLFNDITLVSYVINTIEYICLNSLSAKQVQFFLEENEDHYKMKIIVNGENMSVLDIQEHPKLRRYKINRDIDFNEYIFLFMKEDLYEKMDTVKQSYTVR